MGEYKPKHLTKEEVVKVLKLSGSRTISLENLERDIEEGAPVNEDGTMDIIAYGAWILKGNRNGDYPNRRKPSAALGRRPHRQLD